MPGIGTYVAGSAMLSQNYDHVRVKYPDLAPQTALGLAATTTAAQTVLLNLAVGGIIKSLPATAATLTGVEKLTTGQKIGEVTKNMLVVGGANEFSVAAPALVEGLAKSLGMDLPGYNATEEFQGFLHSQPETILMMALPWAAAGGGAAVRKLFPRQTESQHAQILTNLGYPADRAKAIAAERDPAKQRAMQAEEWAKIPDAVKQQLIRDVDARNIEAKHTGQFTEAPSIVKQVGKDDEGQSQDVYHVLHDDGSLAYSTTNLQAADKVHQGLAEEAVSENFLKKSRLNKLQQSDKLNSDERTESNSEGPETRAVQSGKGLSEKFDRGARLAVEGASRKLAKLGIAVSETNEGSHLFYASDGTLEVRLDHKEILKGAKEAKRLGLPLDEYVKLVAGEETAHAAQLFLIRENWVSSGRPGDFDVYADRHFAALYGEVRKTIASGSPAEQTALRNALADSWNLYVGEFSKENPPAMGENILEKVASEKNGDVTLMAEFSRQIIQLKRDGKITESFYARIQTLFHDWIAKALAAIKRSPQWIDDGRFGEGLKNEINRTEKLLNHLDSDMPNAYDQPSRLPESSSINKPLQAESSEGKDLLTRPIASEVSGDYGAHKLAAPRGEAYMSKDDKARDPATILRNLLQGSGGAAQSQRRKHGRELSSSASLMAWADEHGRNFRPEHFSVPSTFDGGGGEHVVVHDRASGRILKLTKPGLFGAQAGDAGKYLERWALSNRVFGDDVKVEGTVQLPGEDERRVVISQPFIKGRDATATEQEDFLKGKGFTEVDGKWVHPVLGVAVWDTQTPGNVIVSPDGSYHAVDLQIGPAGAEELKDARKKSGLGGELMFSK